MKKIYQLPLLLVALLVTSLSATAHDFEVDGIYYNITDSAALTVEVTYSGDSYSSVSDEYSGEVIIPDSVSFNNNTYSVTAIGDYSFYGCTKLTSVSIPNSVTTIGNHAFAYCSMISITIPNSVTSIGDYAFNNCDLKSIFIPSSVISISYKAFASCLHLNSIEVEIGNKTYDSRNNCNAIIETASNTIIRGCKNTVIPNSVTSIYEEAFGSAFELTEIIIPSSVTSIGYNAFRFCSNLSSIEVDSGNTVFDSRDNCNAIIETASNTLVVGCKSTVIPNSVNTIGDHAFSGRNGLSSITIPNSVTTIGDYAFHFCKDITSITLPNSVTTIGDYVFSYCNSLNSIIIPNSVTTIGKFAFFDCSNLTSISIPKSVIAIGPGIFSQCSGLTSIVVENGNSVYDSRDNCNAIIETATNTLIVGCNSTIIPNTINTIGYIAFWCEVLTPITIPKSVTVIGHSAFRNCNVLTSITSLNPEPPACRDNTFSTLSNCTLYVPFGAKGAYEAADAWKEFTNIVELSEDAGVDDIVSSLAIEVARYDIHGRLLTEPTHGINIVVYSDGTTRKEIVR